MPWSRDIILAFINGFSVATLFISGLIWWVICCARRGDAAEVDDDGE